MVRRVVDGIITTVFYLWVALAIVLVIAAFASCARPLARPTPLVRVEHVDEAESVRAALDDVWVATAFIDVSALGGGQIGSGVLVDVRDVVALVLTAEHVIATNTSRVTIWVSFPDGKKFLGRVWAEDHYHDLALIEVLGHVGITPVRLAPEPPRRLARVWNFGAPDQQWGHVGEARWGRLVEARGRGYPLVRSITGGFCFGGMSGGPVVDERGRLVGVTDTVHLADAEGETDEDNDPEVVIPQMGGAVDWKDVRGFLVREGVR